MAAHSSTLAWKIPWMEEPGRLQSMGYIIHNSLPYFVSRILYLGCVLEIPREICKILLPGPICRNLDLIGLDWVQVSVVRLVISAR